eukprot:XP_003729165.1 PREDICTED: zinc finger RNA-binding protein 2 [Strongylocentrotus purpuratus]
MALFGNLQNSSNNAHWVTSPNNSRENALDGSTSPIRSGPPGFDPAVARPSGSGSSAGSDASSPSQFAFFNTTSHQPPTGAGVAISIEDQFYCKVCKVTLSGLEPAKQHYAGKQHRKALSAQDPDQNPGTTLSLECKVCVKMFTGPASARQHYASSKHKTAMEGAAFYAQSQGQAGTGASGAMKQRSPPGLGPVAKEAPNVQTSSRAGQHPSSEVVSNDASPDGVLSQHQHHRSSPGAPSNPGAPSTHGTAGGGLQQPIRNTSPEGFTVKINPGNQLLRQHIAKVCSSVLQRYLMQLIPDLTDRITDKVLEELSKTSPVDDVSGRETGAMAPPGQNASAEELLQSDSSHYLSTTSLIESCTMSLNTLDLRGGHPRSAATSLNTLDMVGAGKSPAASPTQYEEIWENLRGKNN